MIEMLYQQYHQPLVFWCSTMTGNLQTAEELVQETFLRGIVHQSLLETLNPNQQRAWLYRTAKNLFIDTLRHQKGEIISEQLCEAEPSDTFYFVEWELILNLLPDTEGVIFSMRYFQGYTSAEIGAILCMPAGTVRCKLSSARKHLRKILGGIDNV